MTVVAEKAATVTKKPRTEKQLAADVRAAETRKRKRQGLEIAKDVAVNAVDEKKVAAEAAKAEKKAALAEKRQQKKEEKENALAAAEESKLQKKAALAEARRKKKEERENNAAMILLKAKKEALAEARKIKREAKKSVEEVVEEAKPPAKIEETKSLDPPSAPDPDRQEEVKDNLYRKSLELI